MKRLDKIIFILCCTLLSGCSTELDSLNDRLDSLEDRIEVLEELCAQINTNIASLQVLVNAVQGNDYITSVTPIVEGEDTVGYTITFTKSGPVTIYHGRNGEDGQDGKDGLNGQDGQDGQDGHTPQIGVAQDTDGLWYWTLDGNWMLDGNGNKVLAQGRDGADGADGEDGADGANGTDGEDGADGVNGADGVDGVTPLLKIEEGYWYVSYDDGETWANLGEAQSDGEQSIFADVTYDEDNVYFELVGGEMLTVPKAVRLELEFEESLDIGCVAGETIRLPYSLTGADEGTVVECIGKGSWEAEVEVTDISSGYIVVTAPDPMTDGKVIVLANSEAGFSDMKVLSFVQGVLSVADDSYELSGDAAIVEVEVTTNLDYTVHIPEDAASWLSVAQETKAAIRTEVLRLAVREHSFSGQDRSAAVELRYNDTLLMKTILIVQHSKVITFEDPLVKQMLVESVNPLIDLNGDGEISYEEAEQATAIPDFGGSDITSFNEFQYFASMQETGSFYHSSIANITLPANILAINSSAFDGCPELRDMVIPWKVKSIGDWAFNVCRSMESVFIPEGVETIGNGAFQMCDALKEVVIPASVISLGYDVFNACEYLEKVTFTSVEPPLEIGEGIFRNCSNLKEIIVPAGGLEIYRAVPNLAPYVDLIVQE